MCSPQFLKKINPIIPTVLINKLGKRFIRDWFVRDYCFKKNFQKPNLIQLNSAELLFKDMWLPHDTIEPEHSAKAKFVSLQYRGVLAKYNILCENPYARTGKGAYIINKANNRKPILLQAPHRFYDYHTGYLALMLLFLTQNQFAGAAFNNTFRNSEHGEATIKYGVYDAAHEYRSYMMSFTKAFLSHYAKQNAYVVQIHGFTQENREEDKKKNNAISRIDADILISNGLPYLTKPVQTLCFLLKKAGFNARLYARDVFDRGATRNKIGQEVNGLVGTNFAGPKGLQLKSWRKIRQLRKKNGNEKHHFIHIEFSLDLREKLLKDLHLLQILADCIVAACKTNPKH